ncbi:MAG TPA: beta-galactosidase trimerization domain-containing protein [Polyangia bacterium]|nr:beta-galactosidase trimerization domain-containing protein [Polyangia bacterium]
MTRYLRAFGRPTFLLGANYWSRAGGPRMWEEARWDEATVAAEVANMRALGMNACRAFLFLPTMMPSPPRVDQAALERLQRLCALAEQAELALLPSLLVGHMSGENFGFPGQRGRSPYSDAEVVAWERALARAAAGALCGSKAVAAWVLSNEMPLWGGAAPVDVIAAWAKLLAGELRAAAAPETPIGTGDGVMNLRGGQNGFDADALASVVDYVGPHAYPADADPIRQALFCEFAIRSLEYLGKPVLFEEFGCSSAQAGEAEQAAYWRETISTAMATGAAGALGWCLSDFALSAEAPYRHHPFELGFGVLRADGSEKPAAGAVRAAGEWVRALDWDALDFFAPRAAIVRPSYLETTYPFSWEERSRMVHGLLSAYALARKAGLQAQVVPETHSLDRYDLILVPSTQKLLAPTWEKILLRAADGATVYWSYFGGDYDFHQGMWCHLFETLSGCRHRLRYGVPDVPATEVVELLGDGLALRARAAGGPFARSLLPIEPAGARVVARDTAGRAALTQHAVGRGTVFFLAYPWEFYLGEQVAPEDTSHALYAYLAAAAGVAPAYPASDPRVHTHLVRAAREDLVWALNRSWDPVEAEVDAPGGGGTFAPKEVRVLRVPRG